MDFRNTANLLDSLSIALCVFDSHDCTVHWNRHFVRFFPEHHGHVYVGEPYADNLRRFYQSRLSSEDLPFLERYVADGVVRHQTQTQPFMFEHRGRWLRAAATPLPSGYRARVWHAEPGVAAQSGGLTSMPLPEARDLAPQQAMQLLEDLSEGASLLDANDCILFANDRFLTQYRCASREAVVGRNLAHIVAAAWEGQEHDVERAERSLDLTAALHDGSRFSGVPFEIPLPGGRWIRVTTNRTAEGNCYSFHSEITLLKQQEQELRHAESDARAHVVELQAISAQLRTESQADALTGLPNRRAFEHELAVLCKTPGTHALLYVDLDGFKPVNDELGHLAGDALLVQIAQLLRNGVRGGDTVSRLGGDEFVVLLRACPAGRALAVGHSLASTIGSQTLASGSVVLHVGASIGVRCFDSGDEARTVMHEADLACYSAKRHGRGRAEMYGALPG